MEERKTGLKLFWIFFFFTCFLGIVMASGFFLAYQSAPLLERSSASPFFAPTPTIDPACKDYECLQVCLQQMPNMIIQPGLLNLMNANSQHLERINIIRYKVSSDRLSLELVDVPAVPDDLKKYQDDRDLHQRIWRYYSKIFPEMQESKITYVDFYTDGPIGSNATIQAIDSVWYLSMDLQDFNDQYDVTAALTHEYGHLLTMNSSQVTPSRNDFSAQLTRNDFDEFAKTCPDFFDGNMCAYPDSYLAKFGKHFWTDDIYDPWVETVFLSHFSEAEKVKNLVPKFYEQYRDRFVSEYAAASPGEDMAETWKAFVMGQKPVGETIANQKVLFFYEYSELVQARGKIIQGICSYAAGSLP